jgi:hypothetical protein
MDIASNTCGSPAWTDVAMVAVFMFFVVSPIVIMLWIGTRD